MVGFARRPLFFTKADYFGNWSLDYLWAMMAGGLSWSISMDRRDWQVAIGNSDTVFTAQLLDNLLQGLVVLGQRVSKSWGILLP
jgi:hypothetical protein